MSGIDYGKRPAVDCPRCGTACRRDEADVGVGVIYGPWGCPCGWSESPEYDVSDGPRATEDGYRIDLWGGLTPGWCQGIGIAERGPDGRYVAAPCGASSSHGGHWLDGRDEVLGDSGSNPGGAS